MTAHPVHGRDASPLIGGATLQQRLRLLSGGDIDPECICIIPIDLAEARFANYVPADFDAKAEQSRASETIKQSFAKKLADRNGNALEAIHIHTSRLWFRLRNARHRLQDAFDDVWSPVLVRDDSIELQPHGFALCLTLEQVLLPEDVSAVLQSRTSISVMGLSITPTHQISAGHKNLLYLEISNMTDRTIVVPVHYPVGELYFQQLAASIPYVSHPQQAPALAQQPIMIQVFPGAASAPPSEAKPSDGKEVTDTVRSVMRGLTPRERLVAVVTVAIVVGLILLFVLIKLVGHLVETEPRGN